MRVLSIFIALLTTFCSFAENPSENWSDLNIIDIHAHIGHFRGYDLSTENLNQNIQHYGIRLTLVSNIDAAALTGITPNKSEIEANEETANLVKSNQQKFRGLIWVKPFEGSLANVEAFLIQKLDDGSPVFVGLKFHPEMNHFQADDGKIDAYLNLCTKHNIPAVFHCGKSGSNSSPERIYNIAKRHPQTPIVLYHMGAFGPHDSAIRIAQESVEKQDANLYLETSQANPDDVLNAIQTIGSDRMLFGTDACYYGKNHYQRYSKLISVLRENLKKEEFDNVFNRNAKRLFHLP